MRLHPHRPPGLRPYVFQIAYFSIICRTPDPAVRLRAPRRSSVKSIIMKKKISNSIRKKSAEWSSEYTARGWRARGPAHGPSSIVLAIVTIMLAIPTIVSHDAMIQKFKLMNSNSQSTTQAAELAFRLRYRSRFSSYCRFSIILFHSESAGRSSTIGGPGVIGVPNSTPHAE